MDIRQRLLARYVSTHSSVADAAAGLLAHGSGELAALLADRGVRFVDYAGWQAIDAHERRGGEASGRPRVKVTGWDELLALAGGSGA